MLQLTKTTLFHWDLALEFLYSRLHDMKKDFSGPQTDMRKVQVWMSKVQNPSQQTFGSSASAHSFASHLADSNLPTSTGSQCSQQSLTPNISSSDGVRYHCSSDIATSDGVYCNALMTQPKDALQDPPLTNQRFSEWRNGFTLAATLALTSLFTSDTDYQEHESCVALVTDLVEHYCFLFADSVIDNHKLWTRMWHGPLFLQVFASHFNTISFRVPIRELGSESQGYNGAMALAATAIECMLNLVANREIDIRFFIKEEFTGTKRKHQPLKAMVWKVVQLNGPSQPFSDFLWGGATWDFMLSLERVPHDAMTRIVEEAKSVAACHKARTPKSTVYTLDSARVRVV
ncbi:hypothetical protein EI94DRAFT_1819346 [Lactarius quietus]|nr:hypothetical protein EI94DRAFT_1819346 [Lactarius quietus]